MKRYSLDKMAPGMFENHHGGWVKFSEHVAAVDKQRAALRLCREHFERELADDPALAESDFAEAYRATVAALA